MHYVVIPRKGTPKVIKKDESAKSENQSREEAIERVKVRLLPDRRINRANAALVFDRRPKTLAEWKCKGIGPRPIIVGGRIFYDYDECMAMARGEMPIVPFAK